ncbi:unnamed protein product [Echinostoma caproni]|uniref:ZU5 domain-containing protein n=1 Tax=Echinostoma caproni TaxID=27848 RepID=A0A183AHK9_9TREM|nr:unnamed protein product [Echinostoma caproni]
MKPKDNEETEKPEMVEVPRRQSIGTVTKKVRDQIPMLKEMSAANYAEVMDQFRAIFEEAADLSEQHAKDYIEKAGAIEAALSALAEYNQKALEQLQNLTMNAINAVDAPVTQPGMDKVQATEALVERAKLLVETAEKQLEYSKQLGNVARPLALWRLDASKAVWEAHTALKLAETKLAEAKLRSNAVLVSKLSGGQNAAPPLNEKTVSIGSPTQEMEVKQLPEFTISRSHNSTIPLRPSSSSSQVSSEISTKDSLVQTSEEECTKPQRPLIKFWPKHTYYSANGEEICYVRAPKDCLRKKNGIQCVFSEPFALWPAIRGHNEIIGRFVSIIPTQKKKSTILANEPWIVGIPHSYNKVTAKETVLFMIEAGPNGVNALAESSPYVKQTDLLQWRDLHTTDVVVDEKHYLEVRLPKLTAVTFAPCARLKRDCVEIGRSGGRLVCLSDPRVSLTAPPGAIKAELTFMIQVQHLECSQMPALKEQNKSLMADFVSCSPLVFLTCATKALFSPITLTLPVTDAQIMNNLGMSAAMMDRMTGEGRVDKSIGIDDLQGGSRRQVKLLRKGDRENQEFSFRFCHVTTILRLM